MTTLGRLLDDPGTNVEPPGTGLTGIIGGGLAASYAHDADGPVFTKKTQTVNRNPCQERPNPRLNIL